jgi:TPP-dependent pyruvate/acetoin dehydrogenase alpha subunit
MDFGFLTFVLVLGTIVVWILFKIRAVAIEVAASDYRARQTIRRTIEAGDEDRLAKLRNRISELGPRAAKNFKSIEQEVRKEIQQQQQETVSQPRQNNG